MMPWGCQAARANLPKKSNLSSDQPAASGVDSGYLK
jgi:hypothetical protein